MTYASKLPMQGKFKRKRKPKPFRKAERDNLSWSAHQEAIFDEVVNGDEHIVVLAGPGAGKTATIVEAQHRLPAHMRDNMLFTAFNASVAAKLGKKIPADCKTHHAVGFACVKRHWGPTYNIGGYGTVDAHNDALTQLASKHVGEKNPKLFENLIRALDLCKVQLVEDFDEIYDVIVRHGIPLCDMNTKSFAEVVLSMMERTRESPLTRKGKNVISFTDMIWLPYVHGWQPKKYDYVFVDEAQDLSECRTNLLTKSLNHGGRMFACGDIHQAIYSFAGASVDSLNGLIRTLEARSLPLSISYRCAVSIVEHAKRINPTIEAAPGAIDGVVESFEGENILDKVKSGDAILSRSNYPLVRLCFQLIRKGFKANIQGRDIGNRLLWRIECWEPSNVNELFRAIQGWRDGMTDYLESLNIDASGVFDEADCIEEFASNCDTLTEVRERIKEFFSDDDAQVKLSSVHKAKGLEWDSVIMLGKTFKPDRGAEELNIEYVAITRAKRELKIAEGKLP